MSDVLHAFLAYDKEPVGEVNMKRFGVKFKIKGITEEDYYDLKEQVTYENKDGKQVNERELENLLVAKGVVEPDFFNPEVLKKFGAKDGADAVSKSLLFGEIKTLQEAILRLSGFDDGEELEEAKN